MDRGGHCGPYQSNSCKKNKNMSKYARLGYVFTNSIISTTVQDLSHALFVPPKIKKTEANPGTKAEHGAQKFKIIHEILETAAATSPRPSKRPQDRSLFLRVLEREYRP